MILSLRSPWVTDVAVVVALLGFALAELWVPLPSVQGDGAPAPLTPVVVLTVGLLVVRRRWPLVPILGLVAGWAVAVALVPVPLLFWGQFVPLLAGLYAAARYGRGRQPFVAAGLVAVVFLVLDVLVEAFRTPGEIFFHWTVATVTWSFGWGIRRYESRARASLERAVAVQVAAAEEAVAAVAEERGRIARELHDVVAHAVSVMVVQAGAARQVVHDDPDHAAEALDTIRTTGSEALAEMRRVVSMLREDDAGLLAPQPGTAAVQGLVEEARAGGLAVDLVVEGTVRAVPAGLDLAAYRIVQEALTNVRRHADASRATVVLRWTEDALQVEVSDDGRGAPASEAAGGHGLVGMRERAALYGGRVETTSREGFRVRAVLPVAPA